MSDAPAADPIVQAIAWALLHSLWQGAAIGALTAAALLALRRNAPTLRYAAACAGLAAMALAFGATLALAARDARDTPAATSGVVLAWRTEAQPTLDPAIRATTAGARAAAVSATSSGGPEGSRLQGRLYAWSVQLVPLWLLGVCALTVRLLAGCVLVERLRRAAIRPLPGVWLARVDAIARRVRLHHPVAVVESARVTVPTLLGWVRPIVLLPPSALTGLSVQQLEAVVAHELAHVRRHDYLVNIVQSAIEILLFYHPATWWISRQIRLEREDCCDDIAAEQCGDRLTYARALADLEGLRHPVVGLAATGGSLTRRIHRLLGIPAAPAASTPPWIAAVMVSPLLALTLTGGLPGGVTRGTALAQSPVPAPARIPADTGVVEGRVLDARTARPVPGAAIEMVADARVERSLRSGRVYRERAGDDGRFEVAGVAPGEYQVGATAPGYMLGYFGSAASDGRGAGVRVTGGSIVSRVEIELQREAIVHGRVLTDSGEGLPGVELEMLRDRYFPGGARPAAVAFAQSEEDGRFRIPGVAPGAYYLRAYAPGSLRPAGDAPSRAYLSTYYPAATDAAGAQPIVVQGGEELFGYEFALATGRTYSLSGRLIDPGGPPVDAAQVVLMSSTQSTGLEPQPQANVARDGRFELRDLVPGEYMLMVAEREQYRRWLGATRTVTIDDDDVSGLEIVAQRVARLEGRFTIRGGGPLPFDPTGIRVMLERPMPGASIMMTGIGAGGGGVQPDGTFWIETAPGSLSLQISELPPRWIVGAILLDGAEVTDVRLEVAPGRSGRLEIVLTDRSGTVSGVVTDGRARPVAGSIVVAFPEQSSHWGVSRRIRTTFSRQDGRFEIGDLPPGDYRVVAVASLPTNAWTDPDVLEQLSWSAARARLSEGAHPTVDLTLTRTPEGLDGR